MMPLISVRNILRFLFVASWFILVTDYSQDYALYLGRDDATADVSVVTALPVGIILAFVAGGGLFSLIRRKNKHRIGLYSQKFILFFVLMTGWGAFIGFINNIPIRYIVGDSRNVVVYLCVFVVLGSSDYMKLSLYKKIALATAAILVIKLLFAIIFHFNITGAFSWRYLLKMSCFFPPLFFGAVLRAITCTERKKRWGYFVAALMLASGVYAAQSRGLFLSTLGGGLFLIVIMWRRLPIPRLALVIIAVVLLGLMLGLTIQSDLSKSFGYWGEDNENYVRGKEFRERQSDMLLRNFFEHWLVGGGLGGYDATWEGHEEWLPRPYLVEVEYLNLLAKLGIIGCALWLAAFFYLFRGCLRAAQRAPTLDAKMFLYAATAGLASLMIGSAFQTLYSSVVFHLYVAFLILITSPDIRFEVPIVATIRKSSIPLTGEAVA